VLNNIEGVCASKKSWLFQAYAQRDGMVRIGPCCKTREEAEALRAGYDGADKTWVERVPARYGWRD